MSKQFESRMSPLQHHAQTEIANNRQKRIQLEESTLAGQVLGNIAKKGPDVGFHDILQEIWGSPLPDATKNSLTENISKYGPKFQENRLAQNKQAQSDKIVSKALGEGKTNERNQSAQPEGESEGVNQPLESQNKDEKLNITPEMILAAHRVDTSLGNALDKLYQGQKKDENAKNALEFKKEKYSEERADKSYSAQKSFIDDVTSSYRAYETETKPRVLQLQNLNEDELIGPSAAAFLEKMGIPLGALENPSNELFQKVSQDLLKGLPEAYGSRILKVEVDNFLKTIPTLLNSSDGRRMIASNILKLGEMKEVFYNEMRRQQKHYLTEGKKFPKDFEQEVFDQVRPNIDKLNNEFLQLSNVKSVPEGTVPFYDPSGGVSFVPKNPEAMKWAEQNGGKRIW